MPSLQTKLGLRYVDVAQRGDLLYIGSLIMRFDERRADDAGLCQVSCSACELAEAAVSNRRAGRVSCAFVMPAVHLGGAYGGAA